MIPLFRPEAVATSEGGWFPIAGDLQDAVKTVPVVILQELSLNVLYRRKFFTHFLKNLVDAFIAITGGNYTGRVFTTTFSAIFGPDVYRW